MFDKLKIFWKNIRRLSGDDAYEQYLKHYVEAHAGYHTGTDINAESPPPLLSRDAFFKQWQERKWKGVKRCC